MSKFKPFINEIPEIEDILNSSYNLSESKYSNLPLLSLGFHSYTKQVREKMNDSQLKERLFYLVVNNFEHKINDYDNDLENISNKYLNTKDSIARSFYKIWEILFYFNLMPLDNKNFSSSHLGDNDGTSLQAVIQFRNKYISQHSKNDKYCVLANKKGKLNEVVSECIKTWKSSIFNIEADGLNDETGNSSNLTNIKSLKDFIKNTLKESKEVDLVISSGDMGKSNEEAIYSILLSEIIACISLQKEGGSSIFKIFDTYTNITLKYICILKSLYKNVYICKPLTSRNFKTERFIVCKDFKLKKGDKLNKIINNLFELLEKQNNAVDKGNFISEIFTEYKISKDFIKNITDNNLFLSNKQHLAINNIVEYKNSGNYFGDAYHKYRENQIEANKWWVETFYPEKNEITKKLKKANLLSAN